MSKHVLGSDGLCHCIDCSLIRSLARSDEDPALDWDSVAIEFQWSRVVAIGAWWVGKIRDGWVTAFNWLYNSSPAQRRFIAHTIGIFWVYVWTRATLWVLEAIQAEQKTRKQREAGRAVSQRWNAQQAQLVRNASALHRARTPSSLNLHNLLDSDGEGSEPSLSRPPSAQNISKIQNYVTPPRSPRSSNQASPTSDSDTMHLTTSSNKSQDPKEGRTSTAPPPPRPIAAAVVESIAGVVSRAAALIRGLRGSNTQEEQGEDDAVPQPRSQAQMGVMNSSTALKIQEHLGRGFEASSKYTVHNTAVAAATVQKVPRSGLSPGTGSKTSPPGTLPPNEGDHNGRTSRDTPGMPKTAALEALDQKEGPKPISKGLRDLAVDSDSDHSLEHSRPNSSGSLSGLGVGPSRGSSEALQRLSHSHQSVVTQGVHGANGALGEEPTQTRLGLKSIVKKKKRERDRTPPRESNTDAVKKTPSRVSKTASRVSLEALEPLNKMERPAHLRSTIMVPRTYVQASFSFVRH